MKFGGASVKNADAVRNVTAILSRFAGQSPLLIVVSAMDKTTNHLEILAALAREGKEAETWEQFRKIRDFHHGMIDELFRPLVGNESLPVRIETAEYFDQIERIIRGILLLGEFPNRTYDRIVAYGELLSTCIVSNFLKQERLSALCIDAREIIKTDASYTQAKVIWSLTRENVTEKVRPLFETYDIVVTQGFIASSMEGKVTTLGREGSDYTGSIFANCLGAESFTVWKDVRGILNGDPRIESDTVKHEALSYESAVEMTFYGASVIHPKTIKPLRNEQIPLYVKCFKDLSEAGTTIEKASEATDDPNICSRIVKKNQVLLRIKPRDFSFMDERLLNRIFSQGSRAGLAISLAQISAISLTLCATNHKPAVEAFESHLLDEFEVQQESGMVLRTFINYSDAEWQEIRGAKVVQAAEGKLLAVMEG